MNIAKLKNKRTNLITGSNSEWQKILTLRDEVQKDFKQSLFLSIRTYYKILEWKLQNQKSRIEKIKSSSPDSLIEGITECYFKIEHLDDEMTIRIKMHVLLSIPWIGIGIGSAIMALHQPKLHGAIDSRSWSVLFQKEKKTFSINDYMAYLHRVRELANELKCDVQEIDYILWKEYDALVQQ